MENETISAGIIEEAARRGYPSTFQGFTPRQRAYWLDPLVPWRPGTEAERDAVRDRRGQGKIWHDIWLRSDSMAPRFPAGTCVAIDPVNHHQELEVGRVYVLWTRDPAGTEAWQCARLESANLSMLSLTEDNSGARRYWPLRWGDHEHWRLYEVTHYVAQDLGW